MITAANEINAITASNGSGASNNALHGSIYVTDEQTKGIGRRSRTWRSDSAGNLYMTLLWYPNGDAFTGMRQLNFGAGLAVVRACAAHGASEARLKWPNDVWIGSRKLSGCIVDGSARGDYILVGVGINVNQIFEATSPAISVCQSIGRPVCREHFLADFCNALEALMTIPFTDLLKEYEQFHFLTNRKIRVHFTSREVADARDYDAVVTCIAADGRLVVQNASTGHVEQLSGHEVSIGVQ